MKAVLYIGHGTRSKKGADEAKSFLQKVMGQIQIKIQEISFLELTPPLIDEGFRRCVERGATEITVVPLFLLAAGHIKEDIPEALEAMSKEFPHVRVTVKDPFGVQEKILDALAELVTETAGEVISSDSILLVGRGSSDPGIHQAFAEIAGGIKERLGVKQASVCFLAATEPRLDEGLESISASTSDRVIVVPYLLFSGLLLSEVSQKVRKMQKDGQDIIHTGPLSSHRVIEGVVIHRATEEDN